jgi:hypothetical protein
MAGAAGAAAEDDNALELLGAESGDHALNETGEQRALTWSQRIGRVRSRTSGRRLGVS